MIRKDAHVRSTVIRFSLYALGIFLVTRLLPAIASRGDVTLFLEYGVAEWLQFAMLMAATLLFALGSNSRWCPKVCLACAFLTGIAAVREMDSYFHSIIPSGGWGWPAGCLALVGALLLWRRRSMLYEQIGVFAGSRVCAILWCGFIIAIPFAQLVGRADFWQAIIGDDYNRQYRRVFEELAEALGYFMLLAGSIEVFFENREEAKRA